VESEPEVIVYAHCLYFRLQTYKNSPYLRNLQAAAGSNKEVNLI
jgi:hypothetical protein